MNLQTVRRKPLFIIGCIVAGLMSLFLILALLAPKKGTLSITAPASAPINVTIVSDDATYNQTVLIDAAETQLFPLPPDSYKVTSTAAALKSIDVLTIKANAVTKLTVSFAATSTATKIAAGLDFCPLVVQEKVYDYDCSSYGFIYEQNGMDETKSILFDSQWFEYLVAYRDGFLGFPVDGGLQYIDVASKQMTPVPLPDSLRGEIAQSTMKIATPKDPTKSYFALSFSDEDIVYVFKDHTDTNPAKLTLPQSDFLSRDDFMDSLEFTNDRLIMYAGPIDHTDENEGETSFAAPPELPKGGGKIVEYDLDGSITRTINTPDGFFPDRVLKLTDKYYASDRIEGVEFFYLSGNTLESIHKVSEVVASVPIGDKLYVHANNDIYLFQPGDVGSFSIKSTYSPESNQTLNGIYTGPGYLVLTTTAPGREVSNAYRLHN